MASGARTAVGCVLRRTEIRRPALDLGSGFASFFQRDREEGGGCWLKLERGRSTSSLLIRQSDDVVDDVSIVYWPTSWLLVLARLSM